MKNCVKCSGLTKYVCLKCAKPLCNKSKKRLVPDVANKTLHKTAEVGEAKFSSYVKSFVDNNFHVDNGLHSAPDSTTAIDLLHHTQAMLATANLCLHKIASSHTEVREAFPPEDHASGVHNLDFYKGPVPIQRSLGVYWSVLCTSLSLILSSSKCC